MKMGVSWSISGMTCRTRLGLSPRSASAAPSTVARSGPADASCESSGPSARALGAIMGDRKGIESVAGRLL
jgi:hypothetical protein